MTLPLWGQLQKAQDDAETIEQAIARMISAHEEAPTSHLGAGESLSEHKHNTVIDHPAGSVVADKKAVTEMTFDTTFESIAGWTKSTYVNNNVWPGVYVDYYDGGRDIAYMRANFITLLEESTITKNVQFDLYFYNDWETGSGIVHAGITSLDMLTLHCGFRMVAGAIVGVARWGGSEHVTGTLYTATPGEFVYLRMFYDVEEGIIYFYVNGEQVGTLQPASAVSSASNLSIYADAQTEESAVFRIFRLSLARGI